MKQTHYSGCAAFVHVLISEKKEVKHGSEGQMRPLVWITSLHFKTRVDLEEMAAFTRARCSADDGGCTQQQKTFKNSQRADPGSGFSEQEAPLCLL